MLRDYSDLDKMQFYSVTKYDSNTWYSNVGTERWYHILENINSEFVKRYTISLDDELIVNWKLRKMVILHR